VPRIKESCGWRKAVNTLEEIDMIFPGEISNSRTGRAKAKKIVLKL